MGGGPKLKMAEWVALIHLQQTSDGDRHVLNSALARASERLEAEAAKTGRPRPGTRLRSPAGLARRLTVVRALATGRLEGRPSEAIAAWNMFATAPEDARATAVELLGLDAVMTGSGPAAVAIPARGPEPSFGTFISEREDGATAVYVMQLVGRAAAHLEGAANGMAFVKVGRSNDPRTPRGRVELGISAGLRSGMAPRCRPRLLIGLCGTPLSSRSSRPFTTAGAPSAGQGLCSSPRESA
jgi:hypothetical protein